jgi:hypothetical protein
LQIAFIRRRDAIHDKTETGLLDILDEEKSLAVKLYNLAARDSRIGFEATNHYAYTLNDLMEKVLNVEWLKTYYSVAENAQN